MTRFFLFIFIGACAAEDTALHQHEITVAGELLGEGKLREPGWSRKQLLRFDAAKANDKSKLRQWDFFSLWSATAAVNLTLVDLGFAKLATVGAVDLVTGAMRNAMVLATPQDQFALSPAAEGAASLTVSGAAAPAIWFSTDATTTRAAIEIPASALGMAARGALTLTRRPAMEYLSLATPFRAEAQQFFYEQKIPGMSADGTLSVGDRSFDFAGAAAVMDWGRGQWPSSAVWRWAAASGVVDGVPVAFNLGEGFGDDRAGTENLIVFDDRAHKLGRVAWKFDAQDPMKEWSFSDARVSLVLHPSAKEIGGLELGARYMRLKKGYGNFTGTLTLDDGRVISVDGLSGFAESMSLAW